MCKNPKIPLHKTQLADISLSSLFPYIYLHLLSSRLENRYNYTRADLLTYIQNRTAACISLSLGDQYRSLSSHYTARAAAAALRFNIPWNNSARPWKRKHSLRIAHRRVAFCSLRRYEIYRSRASANYSIISHMLDEAVCLDGDWRVPACISGRRLLRK